MKRSFAIVFLFVAVPAQAHHGKDFLIVESYELPHCGDVYFVSSEFFSRRDGATTFRDEPSLLFGVASRVAGELHVHLERQPGQSLRYEAVAPAIHVQLTSADVERSWRFAVGAEFEIARHSDDNTLAARLVAARSFGEAQLIVNVGGDHSSADGTHVGYAVGFRPDLEARTSWGIEAAGRLEHGEQQEVLVGLYTQPNQRFTLKLGAGAGVGSGKPSAVIRTGIVWRF